ncbi:MAG: EboA domain-containing protein, partial [Planctomycetota bacterium]
GARTNIRAVFESAICDTPYPVRWFDDTAWRQCVIKALFIEAPLWRVHGLDTRLDSELARMALDLAEERRSAGRHVNPQLWLCLGPHAGERGLRALLLELEQGNPQARAAAALGLGRLDAKTREKAGIPGLIAAEKDPDVQAALRQARLGQVSQSAFRPWDGPVPKVV